MRILKRWDCPVWFNCHYSAIHASGRSDTILGTREAVPRAAVPRCGDGRHMPAGTWRGLTTQLWLRASCLQVCTSERVSASGLGEVAEAFTEIKDSRLQQSGGHLSSDVCELSLRRSPAPRHSHRMCWFPRAAQTTCPTRGGSKQQTFILAHFWRPEVQGQVRRARSL